MASYRESLASVLEIRAGCLKEFFEGLAQQEFPHSVLSDVAAMPVRLVDEVLAELPSLMTIGPDLVLEQAKDRQVKRYALLLEQTLSVGEFLESSDVLAIPSAFSTYLDGAIREYLNDAYLCLRANNEFNYYFQPLARFINSTVRGSGMTSVLPEPLALFRFPASSRDDALLHSILAHEVGHFLDEYDNLLAQVLAQAGPALYQQIRLELATALELDLNLTRDALQLASLLKVLESWLKELICDIVGVLLLGPAFAFAFEEYFGVREESRGNQTHPPSGLRLHLVQEELDHSGWLDLLSARGLWDGYAPYNVQAIDSAWTFEMKALELLAEQTIRLIPACQEVIRSKVSSSSVEVGAYLAIEAEMRGLLTEVVPPAERIESGVRSTFRAEEIVIGCWLYWREGTPGWNGMSAYSKRLLLSRLMLKALEITNLRANWQ